MERKTVFLTVIALFSVIILFAVFSSFHTKTERITLPSGEISVRVARTLPQKIQGLSGIALEDLGADGMAFVYSEPKEQQFWMKEMQFDLDVVWIKNGKVMKISRGVRAPEAGAEPARMSSSPFEVDLVLELPAGKAYEYGLNVGNEVGGLK